ncbi:anti-sigma factor [Roseobacter cerasinus]|uniref:Anti-sigma factor n=1 Tax=Roseobacter cerasinus TaxID=2602289 RepID=A0A640VKZ8_9RHOB|nr:anti-sigma factor [Roseobacter cerasinus]GFE48427.1 anti-sigma factor [Roseobacter cerasinus]
MQHPEFTDEELMAYADGELAEDRATDLDLALAAESDLAERLALFVDTRMLSKEALEPMLAEPVPEHLVAQVQALAAAGQTPDAPTGETVVAFPDKRAAPAAPPLWKLPLAATLALAVGLGAGLSLAPTGETGGVGLQIATLTDPQIIDALHTVASGDDLLLQDGSRIAPVATFMDGSQALCREFELDRTDGLTVVSVACHRSGGWDVQMAVASAAATETGYAPASSLEILDAYLAANEAGPPLDLQAEAEALQSLR